MIMLKNYLLLAKPGIILGNAITYAGGYFLASRGHFNLYLFLAALIGLSLVIGAACVFNNYIDRAIDGKMLRTKNRALVKGLVLDQSALFYGMALGITGFSTLLFFVNPMALAVAAFGFFVYVVLYSYFKRTSVHATLIGSFAGAVPPVVGYTAVSAHLDFAAFLLFTIILLWQMPHFYAIALYRLEEYQAANIPVLPAVKGIEATKKEMLFYVIAFLFTSLSLPLCGYIGYTYFGVAVLLGLTWIYFCLQGFSSSDDKLWARKMFIFSLLIVTSLSLIIPFDVI